MTQVAIDNSNLDVTLGFGESTTVPTGETWIVDYFKSGGLIIDGETYPGGNTGQRLVFHEGTTLKSEGGTSGNFVRIIGWVE